MKQWDNLHSKYHVQKKPKDVPKIAQHNLIIIYFIAIQYNVTEIQVRNLQGTKRILTTGSSPQHEIKKECMNKSLRSSDLKKPL